MTRIEILNKLKELPFDKDKYIIISGASLVVHGVIEETSDIDMACDETFFNSINWNIKNGFFNIPIKYYDIFEIGCSLYEPDKVDIIEGFQFMNLEACLNLKKKCNRKKDKDIINLLEKMM